MCVWREKNTHGKLVKGVTYSNPVAAAIESGIRKTSPAAEEEQEFQ
jgi:hypothetical protein